MCAQTSLSSSAAALRTHAETSTQTAPRHAQGPTSITPPMTLFSMRKSQRTRASTAETGLPAPGQIHPSSAAARAIPAKTQTTRGVPTMIYFLLRGASPVRVNSPCSRMRAQPMTMSYPAARLQELWLGLLRRWLLSERSSGSSSGEGVRRPLL